MNLSEMLKEERNDFVNSANKARKMFESKMKELRNKKVYSGLYLIGTCEAHYKKMDFAIGTEIDYKRMSANKRENKIMIGETI